MKAWRLTVTVSLVLVCVAGCSGRPELPDRTDPAIRAEAARIAALLGADPSVVGGPGTCKVRLLGQEAGASFVWAECAALDPPFSGVSAPMRVDGSTVTLPGEGAAYSESVREMFPEDLAEFVLDNPNSNDVRP